MHGKRNASFITYNRVSWQRAGSLAGVSQIADEGTMVVRPLVQVKHKRPDSARLMPTNGSELDGNSKKETYCKFR
ncbi:MAG: hypothetical protein CL583_08170 [Alteromonadaceae bacterium]|nr:hypothetical protein [Alteromonadaceae bacterium]